MSLDKIDSESYEISPLATSEQAGNLPARQGTPVAGLPARQGTPVAGLPARQETPVAGLPARQGTPVPQNVHDAAAASPLPVALRVPVVVAAPVPAVASQHQPSDTIQTPVKVRHTEGISWDNLAMLQYYI